MIITNRVVPSGGQERANFELARYLALERGRLVHLVTHGVSESLRASSQIVIHAVSRPGASDFAGQFLLRQRADKVVTQLRQQGPVHVLANGGNFASEDANWVHTVHSAWRPTSNGAPIWVKLRNRLVSLVNRADEKAAFSSARILLANSELCRRCLIQCYPEVAGKVRVLPLATDEVYGPVSDSERTTARSSLALSKDDVAIAFIGSLGLDNRKGLDTALAIQARLVSQIGWRAQLLIAGRGSSVYWNRQISQLKLEKSVRILGELSSTAQLLAAADLALSPTRFDAYGLGVHEALCRGVPAFVSTNAGVSERIPSELKFLVLKNCQDPEACARALADGYPLSSASAEALRRFASALRTRTWRDMAEDIRSAVED